MTVWTPHVFDDTDRLAVDSIRMLCADMVQKANSGHPGGPMSLADFVYVLWTRYLRHDPVAPTWPNRDRFVLSGGHASALLYAMLGLTGYIHEGEWERFRKLGSHTPGHPEQEIPGVETTTGPLGQGFANAVGLAIAEQVLRHREGDDVIDHFTYVTVGDGDLQEGISYEAASLAGHQKLGRLIAFLRRQPDSDRRQHGPRHQRGHRRALHRSGLAGAVLPRPRSRGALGCSHRGPREARRADAHHRTHRDRQEPRHDGGQQQDPRRAAGRGRDRPGHEEEARAARGRALLHPRRRARPLRRRPQAAGHGGAGLVYLHADPGGRRAARQPHALPAPPEAAGRAAGLQDREGGLAQGERGIPASDRPRQRGSRRRRRRSGRLDPDRSLRQGRRGRLPGGEPRGTPPALRRPRVLDGRGVQRPRAARPGSCPSAGPS